jgi:hypothetical protein
VRYARRQPASHSRSSALNTRTMRSNSRSDAQASSRFMRSSSSRRSPAIAGGSEPNKVGYWNFEIPGPTFHVSSKHVHGAAAHGTARVSADLPGVRSWGKAGRSYYC